jgi:hypothetical protein
MEPCWFLPRLPLLPSVNIHASCCMGSNVVNSEDMPSFTKANPSSSFDQGKHRASSFIRVLLLEALLYVHDYALKCRSLMKP